VRTVEKSVSMRRWLDGVEVVVRGSARFVVSPVRRVVVGRLRAGAWVVGVQNVAVDPYVTGIDRTAVANGTGHG
jgi:hypothetical protein